MAKKVDLEERIDILGQEDDDKAVKWVKENDKEVLAEVQKEEEILVDRLTSKKTETSYKQILIAKYEVEMKTYEIPIGFKWAVMPSKEGIIVFFKSNTGKVYARGTKVCMIPKYDLNAMDRLLVRAFDAMQAQTKRTKSGIYLK